MSRIPSDVSIPGEAVDQADQTDVLDGPEEAGNTESDPDEAIELARQGKARRINKHAPVAPAPAQASADPTRKADAAINASRHMTVIAAKALDSEAKLDRSVLTEKGWYVPQNSIAERRARRKNGEAEMVHIE